MGLPPELKILAIFRTLLYVKTMQPYTESMSTQFHSGMGTQTHRLYAYIFLSLNPTSFRVVPNN